jgi:hypothetical protein
MCLIGESGHCKNIKKWNGVMGMGMKFSKMIQSAFGLLRDQSSVLSQLVFDSG